MPRFRVVPPPGSPDAPSSDAALVEAARQGQVWAVDALYDRHAERANALAFRLLGRDADLDDVVQEAFAGAFLSLAKLRDANAFWSYLAGILVRTVHKLLRRRRLMRALGLRSAEPIDLDALVSPGASPDVCAEVKAVYRRLERMPAHLRVPLVLRRVEGLTLEEIAQLVGISLATVKRRLDEAEKKLGPLEVVR